MFNLIFLFILVLHECQDVYIWAQNLSLAMVLCKSMFFATNFKTLRGLEENEV